MAKWSKNSSRPSRIQACEAQPPVLSALFFEILPEEETSTATAASLMEETMEDTTVQDTYIAYQLTLAASNDKKSSMSAPISAPPPVSGSAPTPALSGEKKVPQYQYKSKIEDTAIVKKIFNRMMEMSITLSHGELLAFTPEIRKHFGDACKINKIPVYSVMSGHSEAMRAATVLLNKAATLYMAPIMEVGIKVQGKYSEIGCDDCGSEMVCISEAAAKEMGLHLS